MKALRLYSKYYTPQGKLLLLVRNQSEKALEYYFTSLVR